MIIIKVCAWCPRYTWPKLKEGEVYSHGICKKHANKLKRENAKRKRENEEVKRLEESMVCDTCGHFISIHSNDLKCFACPNNECKLIN